MKRWFWVTPSLFFFAIFFWYPLARLLLTSDWWGSITSVGWPRVLGLTVAQAFVSSLLAGIIGVAGAILYSELRLPLRRTIWSLSLICFSLPTIVVSLSLITFWGAHFAGWSAIVIAHAFLNFPVFLRIVGTRLQSLDRQHERAALSLGASQWQVFVSVTWPRLRGAVGTAFRFSFLYCAGSFIIVLLLGGGPRFTTLEVEIFQAIRVDLNPPVAMVYAVIQVLLLTSIFFTTRFSEGSEESSSDRDPVYRIAFARMVWSGYLLLLIALCAGPLARLVISGVKALPVADLGSIGLDIFHSVVLALAVGISTLVLALPLARTRPRDVLFLLPAALSPLIISLGWWQSYPNILEARSGGVLAVWIIQSLFAFPIVYRTLREGYRETSTHHADAARSLGATSSQVFRWVELPILLPWIRLAILWGAIFSLGEVTSLLLFSPTGWETLSLGIYRNMSRYDFSTAHAMALALLLVMALLLLLGRKGELEPRRS